MAVHAPISSSDARFTLETRDHNGQFVASMPYRNTQMEAFLGSQGSNFRCEIPYRSYKQVTPANLYPGIHELWFWDKEVPEQPLFAGPLWDATPSSDSGVISVSANDYLSYLAKRALKVNRTFANAEPASMMKNLIDYTNGVYPTNILPFVASTSSGLATVTYKATDRGMISDLIDGISAMGSGVDYYMTGQQLNLYGGRKKPSPGVQALEYGGALSGYSVQYNAQSIANDYDMIGSDGTIGNAVNTTLRNSYDMLYQEEDSGSDLTALASLNTAAASALKGTQATQVIPSIVTKKLSPLVDFDRGDQFAIVINDEYVQYNGLIRVVGWQLTVGQGDQFTVVIYTKDTALTA